MMPAAANAKSAWGGAHDRQGFASNFNAAATVHVKSMCVVYNLGCMVEGSENYDPTATVPSFCYTPLSGCLDTTAINFGCAQPGIAECPNGIVDQHPEQITRHAKGTCTYFYSPPPSPPPPLYPPLAVFTVSKYTTKVSFRLDETVTVAPTSTDLEAIQTSAESKTSCAAAETCEVAVYLYEIGPPYKLVSSIGADRRRLAEAKYEVQIVIKSDTAEDNAAVETEIAATVTGSIEAIQAFIGGDAAPITAATVAYVATDIEYDIIPAPSMPPPSADVPVGAIAGGVVGGVLFLVCIAGLVWWKMKQAAKKKTGPAY